MNKLFSTSALVLLWSKNDIHNSSLAANYFQYIKLDVGKKLLSKCNKVWPFYSEVIKNRKQCVLDIVSSCVKKNHIKQIVILAAGMDPLSLEIISQNPNSKIFEIDVTLDIKKGIFRKIDKKLIHSILLITGDLTKPKTILNNLKKSGWDQKLGTIVVAEGVSYYLTEEALWNLFKIFKTKNRRNHLVLEYLVPSESILRKRAIIPDRVFNIISTNMGLSHITKYDINRIKRKLKTLRGQIIKSYTMQEMEKSRTGRNYHFRLPKSGWIEICHFRI